MRNRFKAILVAAAIAIGGVVGFAGAPAQAATPYVCSSYSSGQAYSYPGYYSTGNGRCQHSSNPLFAYRIEVLCSNGVWYYGSPQVYPTWSRKSCPVGKHVIQLVVRTY